MKIDDSFEKVFGNKKKVLAVMPHPDDLEIYCGGTIARLVRSGVEVRVVKMTLGDKGSKRQRISSKELAEIRLAEDKAAMKVLGITKNNNIYLGLPDGGVDNSLTTIEKIALQIRTSKPDLVITTNPEDIIIRFDRDNHWINHRDHLYTARSTVDAIYPYSRDILFFPHQLTKPGVSSHRVIEFLFVDYYEHPEVLYLGVSEEDARVRTEAHACHKSQYTLEKAQEFTDFFAGNINGKRYECFRYVLAD